MVMLGKITSFLMFNYDENPVHRELFDELAIKTGFNHFARINIGQSECLIWLYLTEDITIKKNYNTYTEFIIDLEKYKFRCFIVQPGNAITEFEDIIFKINNNNEIQFGISEDDTSKFVRGVSYVGTHYIFRHFTQLDNMLREYKLMNLS